MKIKSKSKDYINGFKHGVNWALAMAKCEVNKFSGSLDNILIDSKEAIKSLKEGR